MVSLEVSSPEVASLVHPLHELPPLPTLEPTGPSRDQRLLRREFARALSADELVLRYQPRFRLSSPRMTTVDGVIRWQHRRRGAISEAMLLALAEKARIADDVLSWTVMAGARAVSRLPHAVRFGVTLSPFLLRSQALFRILDRAIDEHSITLERLEIYISEATLSVLDDSSLLVLGSLFDEGVTISVTQFGATLGSLNLLTRIPLDGVKLDSSIIRRLPDDPEATAIVRAVIDVAHSVGAQVIAQGVETEVQRKFLARLRCDEAQGPTYGRPMTFSELARRAA